MDPRTGEIHIVVDEVDALRRGLIPIKRDLTAIERANRQIELYSPCGCGSGEKFKFCCFKKETKNV